MQAFHTVRRLAVTPEGSAEGRRAIAEEVPVAFSYDGTTHAVMMATPADLEDFACGFTLTEGIIGDLAEIEDVTIVEHGGGVELQIRLATRAGRDLTARRRAIAGPVGCGLCGIDSIEQALRLAAIVRRSSLRLSAQDVAEAVQQLARMQPLNAATHAVHAAGFYRPDEGVIIAREDVGRHNALDKLAGAMARAGLDGAEGAVVLTSRLSVELVQKAAAIDSGFLLAISAPTALAVRMAETAGITLAAIVRGKDFEVFTHNDRISAEVEHVA